MTLLHSALHGVVIRSVSALFGFVLGLVGAFLDLYSGYQLMVAPAQSSMSVSRAGMLTVQVAAFGVPAGTALIALGILVATSALASVSAFGAAHMRGFGVLMAVYGLLMLFVGFAMGGMASAAGQASLPGFGMLLVGGLMAINGFMMLREAALTPAAMY